MIAAALVAAVLASGPNAADAARFASFRLAQAETQPDAEQPPAQQQPPAENPPSARFYEEPVPNGFARIHLLSDDEDVRLYKQSAKKDEHLPGPLGQILVRDEQVCVTPCGVVVDIRGGQDMYAGGPGMPSTPKFNLLGRQGDVVIDVHGGSYGELVLGYIGGWGGLALGVTGASVLIVGLLLNSANSVFLRSAGNVLTVGGGVGVGLGVAFGLTGLYLVHDGTTRYEVLPAGTRPPETVPSTLSL